MTAGLGPTDSGIPASDPEASYDRHGGVVQGGKPLDAWLGYQTGGLNAPRATEAVPPGTTLADLSRFVDKIADLERLERHHLLTLAVTGGSDEQIAEAAVHLHMARTLPGVGSSPAEIGTAVVEALRLCGRLSAKESADGD